MFDVQESCLFSCKNIGLDTMPDAISTFFTFHLQSNPQSEHLHFDETFDVVVIGSGAGGITAALTAKIFGCGRVLLAEKSKFFGGTSAISGGALWIPLNHLSAITQSSTDVSAEDSRSKVEQYLRNILKKDYNEDLISAYLDSGPEMVKWLEGFSATSLTPAPMPDYYHGQVEGSSGAGRTLLNAVYDGRLLGELVKQVRYPLQGYSAFGSMQTDLTKVGIWTKPFSSLSNFAFVLNKMGRYVMDLTRYGKGTELCNGNALVGRLLEAASKNGVDLRTSTAATEPITENGRVIGVKMNQGGKTMNVRARKGIVLASGGFARSAELTRKYLPNQDWTVGPRSNTGDGMRIGLASGGSLPPLIEDNAALWSPISVLRPRKGPVRTFSHFFGMGEPGSIVVDGDGRRFANESATYQDFGKATHAKGVRKEYLIGDSRHLRKYGMGLALPSPYPVMHLIWQNYFFKAPTIAALATKLGIDQETLQKTVETSNSFARHGKDLDYNRGEAVYDQVYGDPEVQPDSCLAPIEKGPFYAIPMYPGNGVTLYGLSTNKNAQVLDDSEKPIGGLYAIGSDANHIMNGHYASGGSALGPAMVFGYRAGLHLNDAQRDPMMASSS